MIKQDGIHESFTMPIAKAIWVNEEICLMFQWVFAKGVKPLSSTSHKLVFGYLDIGVYRHGSYLMVSMLY